MRVLLPTIRDVGQVGGTTTHLDMLSRGLTELGHEAHVLYLGAHVPAAARNLGIVWPAGALNRVRRGWGMVYAASVRARILAELTEQELSRDRREQAAGEPEDAPYQPYQVLNAQDVYSVPGLRLVADRYGLPLVLTLHGYPYYESISEGYTTNSEWGRSYLIRSELKALRLADRIVTVDSRLYRFVLAVVPERADRVHALMNFIDTSAFVPSEEGKEELRARYGFPQDKIILFCPRRLVKKNGVVYPALALAAMSAADRERFLLLYAGEGGERGAIEAAVREHGLEQQVRLLGAQGRDAVRELYRLCDIVLVPSVHSENVEEATSLAALEAMASGRPLIAGAVGGLAEMVRHEENGLLVPGGDAEALAAVILRLAAAPRLGAQLAERARRYVVAHHSHINAAERFVSIYEEAIAELEAEGVAYRSWGTVSRAAEGPPQVQLPQLQSPQSQSPQLQPDLGRSEFPVIHVLGLPLEVVDKEQAVAWVMAAAGRAWADGPTKLAVSFNPELAVRAQQDPMAAEAVLAADLRYPDGVGAVWAARQQGVSGIVRVTGIELAERVLEEAAKLGYPVFFLGAAPGVAAEAAATQQDLHPGLKVAGTHHGYFGPDEEPAVVEEVRSSGARVLLVAMGAPRQESFVLRHRAELGARVALGLGGSFDVWAGRTRRAPGWAQRANVEWLWRLAADPRRAGRQTALVRFVYGVLTHAEYGRRS